MKPLGCTFTTRMPDCCNTASVSGFSKPQDMTISGESASKFSTFGVPKPLTRRMARAAGG